MEIWRPVGKMVLVSKDDDKNKTSGGIILPDDSKIPVITCRILEIGPQVDLVNFPISKFDRIIVNPINAIPISFESDNKRYVLDSENILAIQERTTRKKKIKANADTDEFEDDN